ncbi:MAG: ORF6N domain-containing protein [Sulfuritalea sp.]|nr:ORF6N domain-containing protein [Sulfuritalea sp.]
MSTRVPEVVANRILPLRGQRVMLDADLADLYGVETRTLNQAIKRNVERFPPDFMFQLSATEKAEVITNCDHLAKLKYSPSLPYAFTEHGALMLGNVLGAPRAGGGGRRGGGARARAAGGGAPPSQMVAAATEPGGGRAGPGAPGRAGRAARRHQGPGGGPPAGGGGGRAGQKCDSKPRNKK